MADQTFDPRLETLLREVLATEVAQVPMTTTPAQVLDRRAERRRSGFPSRNVGGPTAGRLRLSLSLSLGAVAVLAIALATLRLTAAPDRLSPAAPLPTTPYAWSPVAIDAGPNAERISSLAASTTGLLAVIDVTDRPSELFVSMDGHGWTQVAPDAHPPVGANGAGWALLGTDRGFLLSVDSGVWFSADALEWQRLASPAEDPELRHGEMLAIAAGGPGYVAVGNGNSAWYSTDGSDWSLARVPPAPTEFFTSRGYGAPEVAMHQVVVRGDTLVAFGTASYHTEDRGMTSPVIWVSTDGRTWADVPEALEDGEEGTVAVGPGGFVAASNDDGQIVFRTSADGRTWEQVADLGPWRSEAADGTPRELTVESITGSDAGYVATGGFGAPCLFTCGPSDVVIWTSSDGRSWTRLPSDEQFARAAAAEVVSWGDRFVVAGTRDNRPAVWISGTPSATEAPVVTPVDPTLAPEPSEQVAPPSDTGDVTSLLGAFLGARIAGEGAEQYITFDAPDDEIPLLYATTSGARYERAEFERVDGIEWPYEWEAFKVRLFSGDTIVEQLLFASSDDGRFGLGYVPDGFGTEIVPTTENGRPVPAPYDALDGVTVYVAHPWVSRYGAGPVKLIPEGAGPTTDGGERNAWDRLVVMADPARTGTDCLAGPGPTDAEALAESFRSDPDFEATAPVAVGAGGTEGLMMDVVSVAGSDARCESLSSDERLSPGESVALATGVPIRLYLFDAPEGSSMRVLALAISVPERHFERAAAEWPGPIVQFHAQ